MRIRNCLAVALFCLPFACGGNPHEAAANEMGSLMGEMATAIEGVTDVKSAEAAATKIKALAPKVESLTKKMKALPEPDEATKTKLGEAMGATMQKQQSRLMSAMMKFSDKPEVMKILGDAMSTLDMPGK